jgi:ABC-type transport system involved in multi-copper enzyme maturation permease subunit
MGNIFAIARYTLKEHIRHRVYLTVVLFGVILLGSGALISTLALEEQVRVMMDVGLGGIEFLALVAVLFVTVNLVLDEIQSRSIYLILSHPIERWEYIVGRFAGTASALAIGVLIMSVLHVGGLYLMDWTWKSSYLLMVVCIIMKISVVGALALLVSLVSTSTASSMTFMGFFWVMGHFSREMAFMAAKSSSPLIKVMSWVFQRVTPDFQYFNYRDFAHAAVAPPAAWFVWLMVYAVSYIAVALFLTSWLFSRKEV